MGEMALIELALQHGPWAAALVLMFFVYRSEKNSSEKFMRDYLTKDQETRKQNTEAITELVTLVKRLNGR